VQIIKILDDMALPTNLKFVSEKWLHPYALSIWRRDPW